MFFIGFNLWPFNKTMARINSVSEWSIPISQFNIIAYYPISQDPTQGIRKGNSNVTFVIRMTFIGSIPVYHVMNIAIAYSYSGNLRILIPLYAV